MDKANLAIGAVGPPERHAPSFAKRGQNRAAKLAAILRPEVKVRCQEVATRFIGQGAVGQACDSIEGLLAPSGAVVGGPRSLGL